MICFFKVVILLIKFLNNISVSFTQNFYNRNYNIISLLSIDMKANFL